MMEPWDLNDLFPEPPEGDARPILRAMQAMEDGDLNLGEHDEMLLVWNRTLDGKVQPFVWLFTAHRHGQDCGRG